MWGNKVVKNIIGKDNRSKNLKLKTKKEEFEIVRNTLDYPEAHLGFDYDVVKDGELFDGSLSKKELDTLRRKHRF